MTGSKVCSANAVELYVHGKLSVAVYRSRGSLLVNGSMDHKGHGTLQMTRVTIFAQMKKRTLKMKKKRLRF